MKRITAVFYRSPTGSMPVRDWLLGLDDGDRKIVGADIATVEFGWPVGMPTCRSLENTPLWEVRSTIRKGKVEARVIFGIDRDRMVLLHGHEKAPKRQDHEIRIATTRWRDYLRREG